MTSSTSDDIEVLSTMPPPASRLIGLDKEVLPEYMPRLIGDEEAPRMIHSEEGKIFSAATDVPVGEDSDGNIGDNGTHFETCQMESLRGSIKNYLQETRFGITNLIAFISNSRGMKGVQACSNR